MPSKKTQPDIDRLDRIVAEAWTFGARRVEVNPGTSVVAQTFAICWNILLSFGCQLMGLQALILFPRLSECMNITEADVG